MSCLRLNLEFTLSDISFILASFCSLVKLLSASIFLTSRLLFSFLFSISIKAFFSEGCNKSTLLISSSINLPLRSAISAYLISKSLIFLRSGFFWFFKFAISLLISLNVELFLLIADLVEFGVNGFKAKEPILGACKVPAINTPLIKASSTPSKMFATVKSLSLATNILAKFCAIEVPDSAIPSSTCSYNTLPVALAKYLGLNPFKKELLIWFFNKFFPAPVALLPPIPKTLKVFPIILAVLASRAPSAKPTNPDVVSIWPIV